MNLRINNFSKDSPFYDAPIEEYNNNYILNNARNFMFLTPELGDSLYAAKKTEVQRAIDEYNTLGPYWFIPRYERTYEEGVGQSLYDRWAIFQAKARILKESFSELVKYLDVPAFERGDLYYIQNLVAALDADGYTPDPGPAAPTNLRLK